MSEARKVQDFGGQNVRRINDLDVDNDLVVGHDGMIGGDLRVEGYLEARNLRGVNKGVFATEDELWAAYPVPEKGWLAAVGAGPVFALYLSNSEGEWVATGESTSSEIDELQMSRLDARMTNLEAQVRTIGASSSNQLYQIGSLKKQIVSLKSTISSQGRTCAGHTRQITSLELRIATMELKLKEMSEGEKNEEDVKGCVPEFAGIVSIPKDFPWSYTGDVSDGEVVWNRGRGCFLLRVKPQGGSSSDDEALEVAAVDWGTDGDFSSDTTQYYSNWMGREEYATTTMKPLARRLFFNRGDSRLYWSDGEKLIATGGLSDEEN